VFQTLLYVVGPFLLYGGAGVALVKVADAWIRKRVLPAWRARTAELERYDEMVDAVKETQDLLTRVVLEVDSNPYLEKSISEASKRELYELNASIRTLPSKRTRKKDHA
jgi:hypothetical protein